MLTSAEKIGFTRCSTSAAPAPRVAYQVGFMRPDVARTSDARLEIERCEHGGGRDEIRVSAHSAP